MDRAVKVWQVDTGHCINTWQENGEGVVSLSLSPNGHLLASTNYRGGVTIRQLPTDNLLGTFQGNLVYGIVTFAPDSQTLVVRNQNGSCQLWNVETGQHVQTMPIPRLYEGMNITEATGLTPSQKETLQSLGAY